MASFFKSKVKRDKRYKILRENINNGLYSIDTEKYIKEIETMQATRKTRYIGTDNIIKKKRKSFIEAYNQNQSNRSRCVEIRLIVSNKFSLLERHLSRLKKYLITNYQDILKNDGCNTKEKQDSAVENLLSDAYDIINDLKMLDNMLYLVIDDMDKTHWDFESMRKVIEMTSKPEREI